MFTTSDPVADLLTRIRNGQQARHASVDVPASKVKFAVAKILEKYGYVGNVERNDDGPQGTVRIELKYDNNHKPIISNIRRISKPSRRVYVGVDDIPAVLNGLGIAVLSTSRGVLTGQEAKAANVGGELLCTVY